VTIAVPFRGNITRVLLLLLKYTIPPIKQRTFKKKIKKAEMEE